MELKIANEQVFIEIVNQTIKNDGLDLKIRNLIKEIIDTHRCFLLADSFQNTVKLY